MRRYRVTLYLVLMLATLIGTVAYHIWQYRLCMEIINNGWYCFAHSGG